MGQRSIVLLDSPRAAHRPPPHAHANTQAPLERGAGTPCHICILCQPHGCGLSQRLRRQSDRACGMLGRRVRPSGDGLAAVAVLLLVLHGLPVFGHGHFWHYLLPPSPPHHHGYQHRESAQHGSAEEHDRKQLLDPHNIRPRDCVRNERVRNLVGLSDVHTLSVGQRDARSPRYVVCARLSCRAFSHRVVLYPRGSLATECQQ
mmetsp:Transcript_11178/g.32105  ORF Transcript_11178/g.32105 Transcript_11178/m.32105 type:complete len:203 (+) Transcript_11178:490-1098(+)